MAITVQGIEITDDVITACLLKMQSEKSGFKALKIETEAERHGIPSNDGLSMRVADRLIQRERKKGNLALLPSRLWLWIQ